jgi:hypothetical protein
MSGSKRKAPVGRKGRFSHVPFTPTLGEKRLPAHFRLREIKNGFADPRLAQSNEPLPASAPNDSPRGKGCRPHPPRVATEEPLRRRSRSRQRMPRQPSHRARPGPLPSAFGHAQRSSRRARSLLPERSGCLPAESFFQYSQHIRLSVLDPGLVRDFRVQRRLFRVFSPNQSHDVAASRLRSIGLWQRDAHVGDGKVLRQMLPVRRWQARHTLAAGN